MGVASLPSRSSYSEAAKPATRTKRFCTYLSSSATATGGTPASTARTLVATISDSAGEQTRSKSVSGTSCWMDAVSTSSTALVSVTQTTRYQAAEVERLTDVVRRDDARDVGVPGHLPDRGDLRPAEHHQNAAAGP